ncbi:MAG: phenylalanine--tRNA ligase subunit beta, partial [Patescibacteria group bacterium]
PYLWLCDHLETSVSPEDMQRLLSLSGPSVERIEQKHGDNVFDIEVTTNRMDTASVRGIAREAAIILSHAGKTSTLKHLQQYKPKKREVISDTKKFPITIKNSQTLCSRITCVVLHVKIGQSPTWLKTRLEQVGIRSLNNVIDVTNYVMTELGQPTHAFDVDRLGKKMVIRESKKGEKLTTLDGKTHTLQRGDIVADNGKGELIDLIGIMGTANSVVNNETQRVLFFIEHADPKRIRKTSMGLAIRTNAAQLNEKMIDLNLVMDALLRGITLFQEVADAKLESPILDLYPKPITEHVIMLPLAVVQRYLGIDIPVNTQAQILKGLGCKVVSEKTGFSVTTPTFRPDLVIPVDLVEEIARIYGYHNLPSQLMDTRIPTNYPEDTNFIMEYDVKHFLATLGWQEVYTYSAVSKRLADQSGYSTKDHLKLQNPLNDDHVYLRRSLVPSHEEVIENNPHVLPLSVFELANVYIPRTHDLPEESLRLTLTSTLPYRVVKGHVEVSLRHLYIPADTVEYKQIGDRHAEILVKGKYVGALLVEKNGHVVAEFVWKALLAMAKSYPYYHPISQFSPIIEDMTFTLVEKKNVGKVIETLMKLDKNIHSVEMRDVFHQNVTFTIIYHAMNLQMTTQDIEPIRKKIALTLQNKFKAKHVGKLG